MHKCSTILVGTLYERIMRERANPRVRFIVRNEERKLEAFNIAKKRIESWTVRGQYRDQALRFVGIFPDLREYWLASQYRIEYAAKLFERLQPFGTTEIVKINGSEVTKRSFVPAKELTAEEQAAKETRKIERGNIAALMAAINSVPRR